MSQVKIESLLPDGRGLGLLGRKKVYVNDALPGEEVTLRIDKNTKNTLHARAVKILKRSPERVSSPCPHESFCTGCPLLGASESIENHFKTDKIKEALDAVGIAPEGVLQELMRPAGPFEYRYYAKEVFASYRGQIVLGSYVAGTHMIQDNDGCPVLAQPLQNVMNKIT
ncbi:TRAM domain-containing protein, partial [Myxococcota bacterium]|nr:TRAM domain-containing protein [Myxococcota bacterium]